MKTSTNKFIRHISCLGILLFMASMMSGVYCQAPPPVPGGELLWHTFDGDIASDEATSVDVDGAGNIYVMGQSNGSWGTPIRGYTGNMDIFVAKFDPTGVLVWNTFLGSPGIDRAIEPSAELQSGLAVDPAGNIMVCGSSNSSWGSPLSPHLGNYDGFVAKLDNAGNLVWNTFIGGGHIDEAFGIDIDHIGDIIVTGKSLVTWPEPSIFPFAGGGDAFLVKLNPAGALVWLTYMGTSNGDVGTDVAIGPANEIYVTGQSWFTFTDGTWLGRLPYFPGSGTNDGFVAKFDPLGGLQWFTFMGGPEGYTTFDMALGVAADAANVYVTGITDGGWGAPIIPSAGFDAFVAQFNNVNGALTWNTFIGGEMADRGFDIALDNFGKLYFTGWDFRAPHEGGHLGAIACKLDNTGAVEWNEFLGIPLSTRGYGIAIKDVNKIVVVGASDGTWHEPTYGSPLNPHSPNKDLFIAELHSGEVLNSPPAFEVDTDPVIVVLGDPVENTGIVLDPDDDDLFLNSAPGGESAIVHNPVENTWSYTYPSSLLGLGSHQVTLWVDDRNGGVVFRFFDVNVIPDEENLPPEISCPDDITIYTNVGCTSDQAIGLATATDDYDPDPVITNDAPDFFPLGPTIVTWTATDDEGLFDNCTQTVTVVDNVPPDITCPPDQTVASDEGFCTAIVDPDVATASDNCTAVPLVVGERSDELPLGAPYPFGITTITWTATDAADNSSTCDQIINVNKITTWLEVQVINPVSGIQQYSDLVSFQACVMPFNCNWPEDTEPGLAQGFVDFYIEYEDSYGTVHSQDMGQRPVSGNGCAYLFDAPLLENPEGLFGEGPLTPGIKNVRALFTSSGNDNYLGSEGECENCLEVLPECAGAEYVGVQMQATPSANDNEAEVKLMATVWECEDDWPGDIRNACVTFVLKDPAGDPVYTVPAEDLELVFPDDKTVGIASAHAIVSTNVYTVEVLVGCYYQGIGQSTLVVYEPDGDHITGGGYIIPPDTYFAKTYPLFGQIASDDVKWNYGFNVTYGKKSKRLKGHVNLIVRNDEGGVFQIKSNAMASLGVDVSDPEEKLAVYMAKADLHDVTGEIPVWMGGNLILLITITDRGEPGVEDEIGITLWSSMEGKVKMVPDELLLSSNWDWDNNITLEQYIAGGNLVVHSGGIKIGKIDIDEITILESSLSVYPNPFSDIIWFEFSPATDTRAILEIYDLTGRKLESLMNENVKAGQEYRLNYQPGGDVANGILFYKLIMDGEVTSGKLVHRR